MRRPAVMPAFAHSTHAFHHSLDSALETLSSLGVSSSRITVRMIASGLPDGWIVRQTPLPGEPVSESVAVILWVSGAGVFRALPSPMWDRGNEREPGTEELLEPYDDPIEKARHWLRQGAKLFDIGPDNLPACARWISLFGLSPDEWPVESWYPLALLLPHLQALAGKERGYRWALDLMAGLPVQAIRRAPAVRLLAREALSTLGGRASRAGIDFIAGDRKADLARITVVIGPVSLETYRYFQQPDGRGFLDAVLKLVTPMHQEHAASWSIGDAEHAPRLGVAEENACLGINSHLGRGGDGGRRIQRFEPAREEAVSETT